MPRLSVIALVALVPVTVTGCGACVLPHEDRFRFVTPTFRSVAMAPPTGGLELWLEGETLVGTGSTSIAVSWPDMRGQGMGGVNAWRQKDGGLMNGTVITVGLPVPTSFIRPTRALHCVEEPRCSYVLVDRAGTRRQDVLTDHRYTIFAVARRIGSRGDQYVVMTEGTGCDRAAGLSCAGNSALHLGWPGDTVIRLGHYSNDADMVAPRFNSTNPAMSLIEGRLDSANKRVCLFEPGYNFCRAGSDARALGPSGLLFVGGTAWVDARSAPNWRFEGDIYAVLVYSVPLTETQMRAVTDYLRTKYGPA